MGSVPFSLYDFFAYLSAGALYLLAADHLLGSAWLKTSNPPLQLQVFWLILAYAVGHVNAHWSAWLLERHVVRRLGAPSKLLFDQPHEYRWLKHYRSPLPEATRKAILDKYERMSGARVIGEDMFLFCYHLAKEQCPQAFSRLNTFLSLYGFARNMCFAALVLAVGFAVAAARGVSARGWLLAGLALLAGATLFYRYLKFYRHFSVEVFTSFRTGVQEAQAGKSKAQAKASQ